MKVYSYIHDRRTGWLAGLLSASVLALAVLISGCVSSLSPGSAWPGKTAAFADGPGDPLLAAGSRAETTRNLPRSRTGNAAVYTVFGRDYRVLDSAAGYDEQGLASWYGAKFHGRKTSSGEVYDMHAMTAAHKHLPLPTFARVTNQQNGRSVVVKINDRGPFVDDRIIDLSYAAALQLDMHDKGTARVRVEAISGHEVSEPMQVAAAPAAASASAAMARLTAAQQPARPGTTQAAESAAESAIEPGAESAAQTQQLRQYIQVGAFHEQPNAENLLLLVSEWVSQPAHIEHDVERSLFRVRIGPLETDAQLDQTLLSLESAGVDTYTVVRLNY
jgi:rare lipoprotein A